MQPVVGHGEGETKNSIAKVGVESLKTPQWHVSIKLKIVHDSNSCINA